MKDTTVFEGKTFSDLLRDIHDATLNKRKTIGDMIVELRRMIKEPDHAVVLAPIIKEYLEVMVRNDEHLVKIAAIVQRIIAVEHNNKSGSSLDDLLSDDEKEKLMASALKDLEEAVNKIDPAALPQPPVSGSSAP